MIEVRKTEPFRLWLDGLRDPRAFAKISAQIVRMEVGNFGNVEPVGEGVSETKINYGPGYRIYFKQRGIELIILLGGGDKNSQKRDVAAAKKLARELLAQDME
jgi:putative addiction module killer protein